VVAAGSGQAVVVDAGPDPARVDRCLRDLHVDRVALMLLTHFHADHAEGLPGVLDGRSVAEIEVSPLAEPAGATRRVRQWAADAQVPVTTAVEDEKRTVAGVSWQVVWPARLIRGEGSDPNNASIVVRLETHGVVFLLTGDVEPAAQTALLRRDPSLLHADVLKVPHHGSSHQDPQLITATGARLALICVGTGNPYGHPSRTTVDLLRSLGMQVARTDTEGALAVVGSAGSLRVVTSRSPP
jgi:competence protein ComEC